MMDEAIYITGDGFIGVVADDDTPFAARGEVLAEALALQEQRRALRAETAARMAPLYKEIEAIQEAAALAVHELEDRIAALFRRYVDLGGERTVEGLARYRAGRRSVNPDVQQLNNLLEREPQRYHPLLPYRKVTVTWDGIKLLDEMMDQFPELNGLLPYTVGDDKIYLED